ncbi:MAG: NAD-dependent epimerase/dehydratase family protein [Proteobacteria bacterium]|nr:NAD-dependent epimerase/dehydratase family protein [Pseudomonadota bacterium]
MHRLLIVGFGDVGKRFAARYASRFNLSVVSRTKTGESPSWIRSINWLHADLDEPRTLQKLAGLSEGVIYLAPPNSSGDTDMRIRNFLRSIASGVSIPQRLVYMSTTGVYGDCAGECVSETRATNPQTGRARRRLDAEAQVRAWSQRTGCASMILRVPGIYASDRLPLSRLKKELPTLMADEDSFSNHIHADDLAQIVFLTLFRGKSGRIYNCIDDSRIKIGDYLDLVADRSGLSKLRRITKSEARDVLPEMLWSFHAESRLVLNDRMKKELKVRLRYATVQDGVPITSRVSDD